MTWSDAARKAAAEARRLHAKSKVHDPGRTALARAILGERNKNVMNQSMVSVHGGSYGKAIAARNRDAVSRAAAMLRADSLVKVGKFTKLANGITVKGPTSYGQRWRAQQQAARQAKLGNELNTWHRKSSTQSGTGSPEWVRAKRKGR